MKEFTSKKKPVPCVILMSGSGSNTRALLEYERAHPGDCAYHVTALVTDCPLRSNTEKIAGEYGLPWAHCDIRAFYAQHGEDSIKLDTPRRRELRDLWSNALLEVIKGFEHEFLLFAGFLTLTNLAQSIPCLNVHPGDLTQQDETGRRIYAGLHVLPVEDAILNGESSLRSSVILVQPYTGNGMEEMDEGPIIGISGPVNVELGSYTLTELQAMKKARIPGNRIEDPLRVLALEHIERLKVQGDHVVFPQAASDFAADAFRCEGKKFFYHGKEVLTVEYNVSGNPSPLPAGNSL